jgi:sister-chromatid-cohesion protein PDS5
MDPKKKKAHAILTSISKHCPVIYKAHLGELTKAIADERGPRLVCSRKMGQKFHTC